MTNSTAEKILIAENDPLICDLIARQTLQPFGYRVKVVSDGSTAMEQVLVFKPDILLMNLYLPGLSGKDVLVALNSQGISLPAIIMAPKGHEAGILQAFRMGASDYLMLPVREAEVLACVETALKHVHETRAKEVLNTQIRQANIDLQQKVHELGIIYSIGRSVISITDQAALFGKIIEAVTSATAADMGWLSLKSEKKSAFLLAAHQNLPESLAQKIGQPIEDGLSPLVGISVETLSIHGAALEKFKIAALGKTVLVIPVRVKNQAIGLITLIRKAEKPFTSGERALAEAISDYASISLVNTQLFRALGKNVETAREKNGQMEKLQKLIGAETARALAEVNAFIGTQNTNLTSNQILSLKTLHGALINIMNLTAKADAGK